jgi:hypothetical protein
VKRPSQNPFTSTRAGRTFAIALLLFDLLLVGLAARSVVVGRRTAWAAGERTTLNLARALGASMDGTLRQVDLLLLSAEDRILAHGRAGASPELEADLERLTARIPAIEAIRTASSSGDVEHGVGVRSSKKVNIGDREYFDRARTATGLVVSAALTSRIDGQRVVVLARRLSQPDGSFAGLLYGALSIESLAEALSHVEVGWRGAVALRDRDLELIARFPTAPARSASSPAGRHVSPELSALLASGAPEGVFLARSPVDGVEKLNAYRRVGNSDFHLIVAAEAQEVLAEWHSDTLGTIATTAALMALSLLGAWLALRAWAREEEEIVSARVVTEQADLIRELKSALAEVKTLSGLLPICAHCKKIRDDKGYWNRIENYIRDRSQAEFTHGICPDCAERHFPE